MNYLRHFWFDPNSLISRTITWDVFPAGSLQLHNVVEQLRSGLMADVDDLVTLQPTRRGRQKQKQDIWMNTYTSDIAKVIGVMGDDNKIYALYHVQLGSVTLGIVGLHVMRTDKRIDATLDMIYILSAWRLRGLASSIAEHAGRWAVIAMQNWRFDQKHDLNIHVTSHNDISASLAVTFIQSATETSYLHNAGRIISHWSISA